MSVGFCTMFEAEVPRWGTLGPDHPVLLRTRRRLDRLATDNGLTPLTAFESYEPADAGGLLDQDVLAELPPAQWFAPGDGLAAVRELRTYLDAHPGVLREQGEVVEDLSEIAEELEAAERAGVRFRFAVVP